MADAGPTGSTPTSRVEGRCPGVYRDLGLGRGACSLGRYCEVIQLVDDGHAYRAAHQRFSSTPPPVEHGDLFESRRALPDAADAEDGEPFDGTLGWLADTLDRLDQLNPPRERRPDGEEPAAGDAP